MGRANWSTFSVLVFKSSQRKKDGEGRFGTEEAYQEDIGRLTPRSRPMLRPLALCWGSVCAESVTFEEGLVGS